MLASVSIYAVYQFKSYAISFGAELPSFTQFIFSSYWGLSLLIVLSVVLIFFDMFQIMVSSKVVKLSFAFLMFMSLCAFLIYVSVYMSVLT